MTESNESQTTSKVDVRVCRVDPKAFSGDGHKFVGMSGHIVGISGQFVKVRLTRDRNGNESAPHDHFFTPIELGMFSSE